MRESMFLLRLPRQKMPFVRLFLTNKFPWIWLRASQILKQNRQTPREYVSGENHYYKGARYRLKVVYDHLPAKVEVQGNEYLVLHVRENCPLERRAEILKEWYRAALKKLLPALIAKWEKFWMFGQINGRLNR